MAPLPDTLITFVRRSIQTLSSPTPSLDLVARNISDKHVQPTLFGHGARNPNKLPNGWILGIIAGIGGALVLTAVWFFFRAKNGGFKFQEGDWDDYKSTVLRRKGPDGRTLSNATKSTKLGGGSIVHEQAWTEKYTTNKNKKNKKGKGDRKNKGQSSDEKSAVSGATGLTTDTSSSYYDDPKEAGMRGGGGSGYLSGRPQHRNARDSDLDDYRHEKVARVGGLNRQHDGEHHDYSNTGSEVSSRPLVRKPGNSESDKDRKKREKAERAALEKIRKDNAKREKAAAKAAMVAKKKAAKEGKARAQNQPQSELPGASTQTKDFAQDPITPKRAQPSGAYSFTHGDDETTYTSPTQEGSYYYPAYRPVSGQSPHSTSNTPQSRYRDSRHSEPRTRAQPVSSIGSPQKARPRPPNDIPPSIPGSWGNSSDVGTKVYNHYIPGLSKGTSEIDPHESVSQVGARRAATSSGGYRRGGTSAVSAGRRRDSLSDSE